MLSCSEMARLVLFMVGCLLAQALCVPAGSRRPGDRRRPLRADSGIDDDAVSESFSIKYKNQILEVIYHHH